MVVNCISNEHDKPQAQDRRYFDIAVQKKTALAYVIVLTLKSAFMTTDALGYL